MATARAPKPGPGEGHDLSQYDTPAPSPLASRRAAHRDAHARGLAGDPETDAIADDPRLRASYRRGLRDARGENPARAKPATLGGEAATFQAAHTKPKAGAPSVAGPSDLPAPARRIGVSAGGFLLGVIAYGVVINYVRYGTAGLKAWAGAKAFNHITPGPWANSATSTSSVRST